MTLSEVRERLQDCNLMAVSKAAGVHYNALYRLMNNSTNPQYEKIATDIVTNRERLRTLQSGPKTPKQLEDEKTLSGDDRREIVGSQVNRGGRAQGGEPAGAARLAAQAAVHGH